MTEMDFRAAGRAVGAARRLTATGEERCYVRYAVLGDWAGRRPFGPNRGGWPARLGSVIATRHDLSWCDASAPRATAYDVRRVQVRAAITHGPNLVALDVGLSGLGRKDWDVAEIGDHLTHSARVLAHRGAVVLTASIAQRATRRHRARAVRIDAVYEELSERFGTIHVEGATATALVRDFATRLGERGLVLPAELTQR